MLENPSVLISAEESARRQEAVAFAGGSVFLSGYPHNPKDNELDRRLIAGAITIDQRRETVLAQCDPRNIRPAGSPRSSTPLERWHANLIDGIIRRCKIYPELGEDHMHQVHEAMPHGWSDFERP